MRGRVRSMLDVGSADGRRALRIAEQIGVRELTLVEPSANMRARWPAGVEGWPIRAEELSSKTGSFELITCLWNVLGHVFPEPARGGVLCSMERLLAPEGRVFIDLSHRYNMRHYGRIRTLGRMLSDVLRGNAGRGDVVARWQADGGEIETPGHVFRSVEFERLARSAGLQVERRFAMDYATGEACRSKYGGHLLYCLRRSSSPSGPDASTSTIRRDASPSP